MVVNIIFNYCSTRVCCTRKMPKETEAEETIGFFVRFLPLDAFQFLYENNFGGRGGPAPPPPGYAYGCRKNTTLSLVLNQYRI